MIEEKFENDEGTNTLISPWNTRQINRFKNIQSD
jgi:hypothetical protein